MSKRWGNRNSSHEIEIKNGFFRTDDFRHDRYPDPIERLKNTLEISSKEHKEESTHALSMKYTARHIQRFLEQGKIDPKLWKNHFPSLLPTQVPTCEECEEFKGRTCPGDKDPVNCFLAKRPEAKPGEEQHKKKRDPMLGLGAKGQAVRGTALPRDQSKM
jgi:hypothetical protein